MQSPEGQEFPNRGVYLEVVPWGIATNQLEALAQRL